MFSAKLIYSMGIGVSILSIVLWSIVFRAQIKSYKVNTSIFRNILLIFSTTSILSNIVPIWFYAYRLSNNANPTNIFYAFVVNVYIYQVTTALMFFILYRYDE